jgi:ubiquinone/menaquinone biosynthesis C-methylase UbiE
MVKETGSMNKEMEFTGERLVTGIKEYWALEHLHRYALVTEIIKGKAVVDIASGEGYGSFLMSQHARSVIGVDISEEAVTHASTKYPGDNLRFKHGSAVQIPVPDATVDVLVSFETLEHHDQHDLMMQEIKRVLKPGGITVISTPDKLNYSDIPGYHNAFHVKELYTSQFDELMRKHFQNIVMLFQKSAIASLIFSGQNEASTTEYSGDFSKIKADKQMQDVMYNICFASDEVLPEKGIKSTSVFTDKRLTDQYLAAYGKCQELQRELDIYRSRRYSYTYKVGRIILSPVIALNKLLKNRNVRE